MLSERGIAHGDIKDIGAGYILEFRDPGQHRPRAFRAESLIGAGRRVRRCTSLTASTETLYVEAAAGERVARVRRPELSTPRRGGQASRRLRGQLRGAQDGPRSPCRGPRRSRGPAGFPNSTPLLLRLRPCPSHDRVDLWVPPNGRARVHTREPSLWAGDRLLAGARSPERGAAGCSGAPHKSIAVGMIALRLAAPRGVDPGASPDR